MILLVIRIGAAIPVPGVTVLDTLKNAMQEASAVGLMDLPGGGALQNFSVLALGVSPYITPKLLSNSCLKMFYQP